MTQSDTLRGERPPGREEVLLPTFAVGSLVRRATADDLSASARGRAFGEIVIRFQDMAWSAAYAALGDAHLAEDAAQEAFLTAWRHLDSLREPDAFAGWLQRIVRTQCNRLTRGKRLPTVSWEGVGVHIRAEAAREADPALLTEQNERSCQVHGALAALPEHERVVAVLYYLGGCGQNEIADYLGVPLTTVKKRMWSARRRLRERMKAYLMPEEDFVKNEAGIEPQRPSRGNRFVYSVRLWAAVGDGDAETVRVLLIEDPALASLQNDAGDTPLHAAARFGYVDVVAQLITGGADVSARRVADAFTPLHAAAEGAARIEIAERLLKAGTDVNAADGTGRTALYLAARRAVPMREDTADRHAFCEYLLGKGARLDLWSAAALDKPEVVASLKAGVNATDADGDTPLHIAARSGYRRVLKALLEAGADMEARDAEGRTPLQVAAQPGRESLLPPNEIALSLLREKGARLDLFAAARLGDTVTATALLDANPAACTERDTTGATPLCHAAWCGQLAMVELLLERGADPGIRDEAGRGPASVRYTPEYLRAAVINRLTVAGVSPDLATAVCLGDREEISRQLAADPSDATQELINWASCHTPNPEVALLLAHHGAPLSVHAAAALGLTDELLSLIHHDPTAHRLRDERRETPLHRAASRGQEEAIRVLLEANSPVNAAAQDGGTALHRAAANGYRGIVETLLSAGADPQRTNHRGESPLFSAISAGDAVLVSLLLEAGTPAEQVGAGKRTPLHLAAEQGSAEIVALLLARGVPRDPRNYFGGTPLHLAAREGHTEIIRLLVASGVDLLARDNWYRTALHTAVWFGQSKAINMLIEFGIAVTELSYGYSSTLHTAAEAGRAEIAELLLSRGADVNARSDFGRTPLHDAVHGGHTEMVRLLLARGANPSAANNRSVTPLHWAAARGDAEIVRILLAAGADTEVRSYKDETPQVLALRYGQKEVASLL